MNVKIMNQIKFVLFMTLTLLLTISSFASSASAGTNLIANPGFESGSTKPLNWALASSNGNVPIWDTVPHSGTRSIKVSIPGATKINSGYPLSDSIKVEPLKDYTLSAWVKSEGAVGGPTVRVVQYDVNMNKLSQLNLEFDRGTNGWTQKQLDFQTRSNTAYIMVYANIWSGYGNFWLDDVVVSPKSTTSTPLPQSPTPTPIPTPTSTSANFIANPGFESGSTKPLNWALASSNGNVPIWDTVPHSGTRSIKVSIPGTTKINSGYPLSDSIKVEPLKDYALSAWVKSDGAVNGPTVRVVQYDANMNKLSQLNLEFDRGTNGWTQKQLDFKTFSNTAYILVYANIWTGYGTFWLDDVLLSPKSTTSTTSTQSPTPTPISTPIPVTKKITINIDKTLNVDGKKTFPISINNICNSHFEKYAGVEPCDPSKNIEFLNTMSYDVSESENINKTKKAGIHYTLNAQGLDTTPQSYIDNPYLFGYYLPDEPADGKEASILSLYNKMKTRDSTRPVIMGQWKDMVKWSAYADVMLFGLYPVRDDPSYPRDSAMYIYEHLTSTNFFQGTELSSFKKPVWASIQANGLKEGTLVPLTPKEARANTYTAITMNVNGIYYWSYLGWGGSLDSTTQYPYGTTGLYNNATLHAYYRQLARELKSINDILVLPTKDYSWEYRKGTGVSFSKILTDDLWYRTRTNFNYMLKQNGNARYLIVVNKDSRPISDVVITINGMTGAMTAKTLGLETSGTGRSGRTLSVNNGKFTDSFDGYAVHIYKVS